MRVCTRIIHRLYCIWLTQHASHAYSTVLLELVDDSRSVELCSTLLLVSSSEDHDHGKSRTMTLEIFPIELLSNSESTGSVCSSGDSGTLISDRQLTLKPGYHTSKLLLGKAIVTLICLFGCCSMVYQHI